MIHHSRSPASAWLVSSFLGLSIAILLDLCDIARSHADSVAQPPEHAENHAREVALEVGATVVPLYDGGRGLRTYPPSNSMLELPALNPAQPLSVPCERTDMVRAHISAVR
ncbi:hypothetical protein C8R45DRAFT_1007085 [Mycena sanguinolenta]|nr:hypothetical protein C8R45DRAFT_1007085 [Mycena sanguinolenta]